ncbi:HSP20 family protein [Paenibacillus sp. UNCCL117]|uniref:Hsp20/alpha crystallin family protein n=1 Tax=unclassified Paenibacillus TaxID=185978 RepID=UPI00088A2CFA|nr:MULTISPECIES: Hsp20/alpha crystallin family protein [unclassified Paenibacillus]SDD56826.1 HSP20 family protein [Paenibacillus sp. cl123]SFW51308.1 HSP20 family protein [Paenibacillus sp. UNCCL117]
MFDLVPFRRRNEELLGQMLRTFNDAFDQELLAPLHSNTRSFRTDIRETDTGYLIEAELPGFAKEDIDIDVNDKYLTIRAKRNQVEEEKDEQGKIIRRERHYGEFARQFYVEGIEEEGIKAKLQDGVLKLDIPKKAKKEPANRRIGIE